MAAYLLNPLPGESIYSLCARVAGTARAPARNTSMWLLGHPAGASRHELTFGLRVLEGRYGGTCGPLALGLPLLRTRTTLGAVLPFLEPESRAQVALAMGESSPVRLARQMLGVKRGRDDMGMVLRRCPECAAEDIADLNFTYWRTLHQFAGVWICPWHHCPLEYLAESSLKIQEWRAAHRSPDDLRKLSLDSSTQEALTRVMSCVIWCASHLSLRHGALMGLVRERLQTCGLSRQVALTTPAECSDIHEVIAARLAGQRLPHFRQFNDEQWVRKTLTARGFCHPLRWAVLIASTMPSNWRLLIEKQVVDTPDSPSDGFLGRVNLGVSSTDLDTELARAWRKASQIDLFRMATGSRARHAPASIYDALNRGQPLKDASSHLGMSSMQIKHWLRKDPDLARHWRVRKISAWVAEAKIVIEGSLAQRPEQHRTSLLYGCTAAYRILERYAPEVLESMLPPVQQKYSRQLPLPLD